MDKALEEFRERCESVVDISETYEESYPTGKRPYEMEKFFLYEKETVWIGESRGPNVPQPKDEIILEARRAMHGRLVTAVGFMVDKAVREGRLVNLNRNKVSGNDN
jgi:hypothetical protein